MFRTVKQGFWVVAIAATFAGDAHAQISSTFLEDWDLSYQFSRNSARREALAGISASLQDESNEINMWDYGRNVAGFLGDRDAWAGDFWATLADRERRVSTVGSSASLIESGIQLSFRSYSRALGLEGNLVVVEDQATVDQSDRKFTGPTVSFVGNQVLGNFVLGAAVTLVSEDENLNSPDPLAIEHGTSRTDWKLGLVYWLGDKIDLGANLTLSDNRITGFSSDAFHRDKYDWDRPVTEFGFQAMYGAGSDVSGGAFIRRTRLDGGEVLSISWSREFFINPSGVDLRLSVPLLDEELKETVFGTKWLVRLGRTVDVGVEAAHETGTYVAVGDPTFSTFVPTTDNEFDATRVSGGVAVRPVSRLSLFGQVDVSDETEDRVEIEGAFAADRSAFGLRAAVEYFWTRHVALRVGGERTTWTRDDTAPTGTTSVDFERTRLTGGVGWAPRGGVFLLDLAGGVTSTSATDPAAFEDETDGFSFAMTGRTLFR